MSLPAGSERLSSPSTSQCDGEELDDRSEPTGSHLERAPVRSLRPMTAGAEDLLERLREHCSEAEIEELLTVVRDFRARRRQVRADVAARLASRGEKPALGAYEAGRGATSAPPARVVEGSARRLLADGVVPVRSGLKALGEHLVSLGCDPEKVNGAFASVLEEAM